MAWGGQEITGCGRYRATVIQLSCSGSTLPASSSKLATACPTKRSTARRKTRAASSRCSFLINQLVRHHINSYINVIQGKPRKGINPRAKSLTKIPLLAGVNLTKKTCKAMTSPKNIRSIAKVSAATLSLYAIQQVRHRMNENGFVESVSTASLSQTCLCTRCDAAMGTLVHRAKPVAQLSHV